MNDKENIREILTELSDLSGDSLLEEAIRELYHFERHDKLFYLRLTCSACPEQYDVFNMFGKQIAYIRLRYGRVKGMIPDVGGKLVYQYDFDEPYKGSFCTEDERLYHLNKIIDAVFNES